MLAENIAAAIAAELHIKTTQTEATIRLLDEIDRNAEAGGEAEQRSGVLRDVRLEKREPQGRGGGGVFLHFDHE